MELTVALAMSIISCVICVLNFALNRKDKAVKDTKETTEELSNKKLFEYRLDKMEEKLDKILNVLDGYEKVIDERILKAIEQHIREYHK